MQRFQSLRAQKNIIISVPPSSSTYLFQRPRQLRNLFPLSVKKHCNLVDLFPYSPYPAKYASKLSGKPSAIACDGRANGDHAQGSNPPERVRVAHVASPLIN